MAGIINGVKKIFKMADQMINRRGWVVSSGVFGEGKRIGEPQYENSDVIVYIRFDAVLFKALL